MVTVGAPTPGDREAWAGLYRGYARFYEVPMTPQVLDTVWRWTRDPDHPLCGRLARDDAAGVVGLMQFRAMPSPLRGAEVGFLDDLFVAERARGRDVGRVLLEALRGEARQRGWPLVRWITRDGNYRARTVYDRCATRTDWVTYQLVVTEPALDADG